MSKMIECPFCQEDDFDLEGLATHLRMLGWCPVFASVISRMDTEAEARMTRPTDEATK